MAITINHQTNTISATSGNLLIQNGLAAGSASIGHIEYNGTTASAGEFDGGTVNPSATTRLNYGGYFYATRFYGDGSQLTNLPIPTVSGSNLYLAQNYGGF